MLQRPFDGGAKRLLKAGQSAQQTIRRKRSKKKLAEDSKAIGKNKAKKEKGKPKRRLIDGSSWLYRAMTIV